MLSHILVACICVLAVEGHKVLVIFPVPSHSHASLGRGVARSIVDHLPDTEVTLLTAYPRKNPPNRVKDMDLSHLQVLANINMAADEHRKADFSLIKVFEANITRMLFETPSVQEMLKTEQFDAVITEWFFSDVYAGFGPIFQCPWILSSGMVNNAHFDLLMDTFTSPAVYPMVTGNLQVPLGFVDRIKNTFATLFLLYTTKVQNAVDGRINYMKYFGPAAKSRGVVLPDYDTAVNNASMLFLNSHPSMSFAQALPPNVLEVGGYHIEENVPKLPEDLQKFLDNANNGVVYFSMGSVLKSSKLPEEMRKELIKVLGDLPYTVLWKFEEDIQGLPKNVHVMKWVPQQSVLQHPNVKLFITHGGLLSTLEAVNFGVPLIAIPVFGDQPGNADRCAKLGFAIKVPFSDNVAPELRIALKEMLSNKSYYKKAKELSTLFKSRVTTPSKTIAHGVKLVIESKGALHLRSAARLYTFYQRWLLDQLAVLLIILLVIYLAIKRIIKQFFGSKKVKSGGKKQKSN